MLEFKRITKSYGSKLAVNDLSFDIDKAEVLALLGPNGAGKSTSMKMLMGYITPTSGAISVCGFDMASCASQAQARMGYLPEGTPLYTEATVAEFIHFCASARGVDARNEKDAVARVVSLCGLENVKHQLIDTLSKGYRQRTCFAQSIVHDPQVLVMDEPTDGLDPNQKQDIQDLIREMGQSKQILLSTHIMEEAEYMADRILLLSHGRAEAVGTINELRSQLNAPRQTLLELAELAQKVDSQTVCKKLESLSAVVRAESQKQEDSLSNFILHAKEGSEDDLIGQVIRLCSDENWPVQGVHTIKTGLKDIFQEVTQRKEANLSEVGANL